MTKIPASVLPSLIANGSTITHITRNGQILEVIGDIAHSYTMPGMVSVEIYFGVIYIHGDDLVEYTLWSNPYRKLALEYLFNIFAYQPVDVEATLDSLLAAGYTELEIVDGKVTNTHMTMYIVWEDK